MKELKNYVKDISSCCKWGYVPAAVLFSAVIVGCVICRCDVYKCAVSLKRCTSEFCSDTLYCFLFALAVLCVLGGFAVICMLYCHMLKKQALLTYAYDKALEKLEEVKQADDNREIKDIKNNTGNQSKRTEYKNYKKTITKIFQAYCQSITVK